ncbi:hypothetical protein D3C81_1944000 [compost metagenome]
MPMDISTIVVMFVCRSFICRSLPEATSPIIPAIFSVASAVRLLSEVSLTEDAASPLADAVTCPIIRASLSVIVLKFCASSPISSLLRTESLRVRSASPSAISCS